MRKFRPVGYLKNTRGFRRAGPGLRNHSSDTKRADSALFVALRSTRSQTWDFLAPTPSRRVKKKGIATEREWGLGGAFLEYALGNDVPPGI